MTNIDKIVSDKTEDVHKVKRNSLAEEPFPSKLVLACDQDMKNLLCQRLFTLYIFEI